MLNHRTLSFDQKTEQRLIYVRIAGNSPYRTVIFLQASEADQENGRDTGAVTELRYNWKGDQFLKLRMEEDRAILGFEKRRSF